MDQPIALTLAGIQNDAAPGAAPVAGADDEARRMLDLKSRLDHEKAKLAERRMALAREHQLAGGIDEITLQVPREEFRRWFRQPEAGFE